MRQEKRGSRRKKTGNGEKSFSTVCHTECDRKREQWEKNPYHADNHFRPQVDFIVPRCKVFTYPHYHELINYLEIEVGLPKSEFKKIGPSSAPLPQISPESESLIKEWYCNDYELFFGGSGEIYDSQRRISFNYHSPPCALV